jgi:hypothetical protein
MWENEHLILWSLRQSLISSVIENGTSLFHCPEPARRPQAGRVATLYPEFTLYGTNVHAGERVQHFHGVECPIGSSMSDALSLESDTSFLGGPCGRSCPPLWR